ncbi:MAG: RHS repeat-associated core domain-containing protein [Deltaproteobacteria bacterium]|nr:RHS repeat-associated core domain-containing protein [Deltaproteobacteria bacterium]
MVDAEPRRVVALHHDHLGSLLASSSEAGAVVARVEHYPFGQLRWQSDGAGELYEYTGKEHDDAAGLTYFGARYLDGRLGRWVSADRAFQLVDTKSSEAVGANEANYREGISWQALGRYTYSGNAPIDRVDRDGRLWHLVAQAAVPIALGIAGAVISGGFEIMNQQIENRLEGKDPRDINYKKVMIAAAFGAAKGALGGPAKLVSSIAEDGAILLAKKVIAKQCISSSSCNKDLVSFGMKAFDYTKSVVSAREFINSKAAVTGYESISFISEVKDIAISTKEGVRSIREGVRNINEMAKEKFSDAIENFNNSFNIGGDE